MAPFPCTAIRKIRSVWLLLDPLYLSLRKPIWLAISSITCTTTMDLCRVSQAKPPILIAVSPPPLSNAGNGLYPLQIFLATDDGGFSPANLLFSPVLVAAPKVLAVSCTRGFFFKSHDTLFSLIWRVPVSFWLVPISFWLVPISFWPVPISFFLHWSDRSDRSLRSYWSSSQPFVYK